MDFVRNSSDDMRSHVKELKAKEEKSTSCCQCFAQVLFVGTNIGLAISGVGYVIAASVLLGRNGDAFVGPTYGIIIFGIVLQFFLAFSIFIGLRAYYIKSEMWLIVHAMLLGFILSFSIIGADFVSVLGNNIEQKEGGFNGMTSDIEESFIAQVFNDCCVPINAGAEEVEANVTFSWGDIVPDELCSLLVDVEDRSFVGNELENSCGGLGVFNFNDFRSDFISFTEEFYTVSMFILWSQTTLMLLDIIVSLRYICCVSLKGKENKENKRNKEEEEEDNDEMSSYKYNEKNAIVPDSVRMYISRVSSKMTRTADQQVDGPPMPKRPTFMQMISTSFNNKRKKTNNDDEEDNENDNEVEEKDQTQNSVLPGFSFKNISKKFIRTKKSQPPALPNLATKPNRSDIDLSLGEDPDPYDSQTLEV